MTQEGHFRDRQDRLVAQRGDLPGLRAQFRRRQRRRHRRPGRRPRPPGPPRRPGDRRDLVHAVVPVADGRRRLRRRRLPRHRADVRHAGRGREAHRGGPRLGIQIIIDIVPNHCSDEHRWFQAGAGRRPGLAGAGTVLVPARPRAGRRAAEQLAVPLRRPGVDPRAATASGTCTCSPRAAGLQLGQPGRPPGVRGRAAVLVRPRRRRLPHRRRRRAGQGPGACPTSKTATRRRSPTMDGVHEIYRSWRKIADSYPGSGCWSARCGCRTWRGSPATCAATSCTRRSTSTSCPARGMPARFRAVIDSTLRAHDQVGAPATWVLSNHDVTRHVTRYGRRADTAFGFADRQHGADRPGAGHPAGAGGGAADAVAARRRCTSTRARSWGCGRSRTSPDELRQDPVWARTERRRPGPRRLPRADPVVGRRAAVRLRRAAARGCRSRRMEGVHGRGRGGGPGLDAVAVPSGPAAPARPPGGRAGVAVARRGRAGVPDRDGVHVRAELLGRAGAPPRG